ncbi:MAG: DUF5011 domain-containing protein [Clostridia bacterium]|nr:DUF5011 domain-containing protein [Clostridia bacterium]
MKRFAFLIVALATLLTACATPQNNVSVESDPGEHSTVQDTTPPKIRIIASCENVVIKKGDAYDIMNGVRGSDDTDGDITDQIQINKGGFDPEIPGEYTVTYFLSDAAGNAAEPKFKKITVTETAVLEAPPVWEGKIEGEVLNPSAPPVFGGAWYHKVVSSRDKWVGIEVVVTLPEVDIERYNGSYNSELNFDPNVKNLDNPSVYLGGHALSESDVGLSFSRALVNVSSSTLSTGCIAFRPFWRYITETDQDVGGYDAHGGEYAVSANGNNCIANYHWKYTEYYYLPGDKLRIVVYVPEENKMQLQIEVLEKSSLPEYVKMREDYGWKDPADFLSPVFTSPGHGTGILAEFKRVNAIDQSGNEGGVAISTQTEVKNIIWHETYLYRVIDGTLYRVPMNEERRATTSAPEDKYFTVSYDGVNSSLGGEIVTIHPGYTN